MLAETEEAERFLLWVLEPFSYLSVVVVLNSVGDSHRSKNHRPANSAHRKAAPSGAVRMLNQNLSVISRESSHVSVSEVRRKLRVHCKTPC